jgi:hypothetical protein
MQFKIALDIIQERWFPRLTPNRWRLRRRKQVDLPAGLKHIYQLNQQVDLPAGLVLFLFDRFLQFFNVCYQGLYTYES